MVGTGKYKNLQETDLAIQSNGAEIITATLKAAKTLIDDGFEIMVYTFDDPIVAQELESMGCVTIMPLGSLIGSGLGILNPHTISIIKDNAKVPVLVDAGAGTASDAAIAMELGCDGVSMNTAMLRHKTLF